MVHFPPLDTVDRCLLALKASLRLGVNFFFVNLGVACPSLIIPEFCIGEKLDFLSCNVNFPKT